VEHNENGHLIGARKFLILKVGTAGFEPTASCTPRKAMRFPRLSLLRKSLKNIAASTLWPASLIPVFHSNMSLQYVSVGVNNLSLPSDRNWIMKKGTP
jgi:hypothetical protein